MSETKPKPGYSEYREDPEDDGKRSTYSVYGQGYRVKFRSQGESIEPDRKCKEPDRKCKEPDRKCQYGRSPGSDITQPCVGSDGTKKNTVGCLNSLEVGTAVLLARNMHFGVGYRRRSCIYRKEKDYFLWFSRDEETKVKTNVGNSDALQRLEEEVRCGKIQKRGSEHMYQVFKERNRTVFSEKY